MDVLASPQVRDDANPVERAALLDGIIKQTRRDFDRTMELIELLQEQSVRLKKRLREAEREQASLLTEAARV